MIKSIVYERRLLSDTEAWLAWHPVQLQLGQWVWLKTIRRWQADNGMVGWWVYALPEECLSGAIPKRSYEYRGAPLDFKAAKMLGARGMRLHDIVEGVTPTRAIKGIVVDGGGWINYSETGEWG